MAVTREQAFRHLKRATFGPKEADVTALMASDIDTWLTTQLRMSPRADHVPYWRTLNAARVALDSTKTATANDVISGFYKQALNAPDQLRQRMAYALSQIMVVSTLTISGPTSLMVASFYDMLTRHAFGNFRDLLFDVCTHPAMGKYLSHLGNEKANPTTGSLPDQNFAREVMQLFSIGLYVLNADGSPVLVNGVPQETYTQDDIEGMARVMTGWSWAGPSTTKARFQGGLGMMSEGAKDTEKYILPMQPYPQYHETGAKTFLGQTIAANTDALATLNIAVDALFNHQSTGPFICRQLYQRLVDSNPTPAEVAKISAVFANDGNGVRGNLAAVARAILLDAAGLTITAFTQPVVTAPTLSSLETYRTSGTAGQQVGFYSGVPYKVPNFPDTWSEAALGGSASLIFDIEVTSGTVPAGGRPILFLSHPNANTGFRDWIASGRPAESIVSAARASSIGWVIVNGEFPHPYSSIAAVPANDRLPFNALGRMLQHVRSYHSALNLNRSAVYAVGRSRGSAVLANAFGRELAYPAAATYWERQSSSDILAVYVMQPQVDYYAPTIAGAYIVPADVATAVAANPTDTKDPRLAAQSSIAALLGNTKANTLVWADAAEQWNGTQVTWSAFQTKDMVHYPDFVLTIQQQLTAAGKANQVVVNHSIGPSNAASYSKALPWFEAIMQAKEQGMTITAAEAASVVTASIDACQLYYLRTDGTGAGVNDDGTGAISVGSKVGAIANGALGFLKRTQTQVAADLPAAMTVGANQPTVVLQPNGKWAMSFGPTGVMQVGATNTSAEAWIATATAFESGFVSRAATNYKWGKVDTVIGLAVGKVNGAVPVESKRIHMQHGGEYTGTAYALV